MVEWGPAYDEVEDLRSFANVAEERGYSMGENAEQMAVGTYDGDNVFVEQQSSEEASYNLFADVLRGELSEYNVRVPLASYDEETRVQNLDSEDSGVLITKEITPNEFDERMAAGSYVDSLVDTFAFQALMGQGDVLENTSLDPDGFFAYDFGNSGADIRGIYTAVKSEAQKMAKRNNIDSDVESYDEIGERAVQMANDLDLESLRDKAEELGLEGEAYMQVIDNIRVSQDGKEIQDPISEFFSPTSPQQDSGAELL